MMQSRQRVTVAIPVFNGEEMIGEAIDSVLAQTYEELELIIVDDGSTDRSIEVAERHSDERVSVVSVKRGGPSWARNIALASARGEYIAFLDADDYWLSNRLERQVCILESEPTVEVVGHLMRYEPLGSKRTLGVTGDIVDERAMERVRAGALVPFPLSSSLFRTDSVRAIGGFDEELSAAADLDVYARVAQKGTFITINEVLGAYRLHSDSISAKHSSRQVRQARFIRARLAAESEGRSLTLHQFEATYKPTFAQRYGDLVHRFYRRTGLAVAEHRWLPTLAYGAGALILGPRYTANRFLS